MNILTPFCTLRLFVFQPKKKQPIGLLTVNITCTGRLPEESLQIEKMFCKDFLHCIKSLCIKFENCKII